MPFAQVRDFYSRIETPLTNRSWSSVQPEPANLHIAMAVGYVVFAPILVFADLCDIVQQFMSAIGRKCSIVNLDPANDRTGYECALDVREIVRLEDIMEDDSLGPNGGILYAMEELEHNIEWLEKGLSELGEDYVLFDCPGQVELFTHHSSLRNIFFRIQSLGYRVGKPSLMYWMCS
jgi:GTPase SAR1 family protein